MIIVNEKLFLPKKATSKTCIKHKPLIILKKDHIMGHTWFLAFRRLTHGSLETVINSLFNEVGQSFPQL